MTKGSGGSQIFSHGLKKMGEDVFAAAAKSFLNFILAVYLLLSVAD
jgi:hypothetical protein